MVILTLRTLQFSRFAMLSVLAVASAFVRKLLVFNERGFHLLLRVVVHDIVKKLDERLNRKLPIKGESMRKDSLIPSLLGIPPIQISRELL